MDAVDTLTLGLFLLAVLSLVGTVGAARVACAERSGPRYVIAGILGLVLGLVTITTGALALFLWGLSGLSF